MGFNQFHLNHALATPASTLAAPNVDTIYGYGWLDNAQGHGHEKIVSSTSLPSGPVHVEYTFTVDVSETAKGAIAGLRLGNGLGRLSVNGAQLGEGRITSAFSGYALHRDVPLFWNMRAVAPFAMAIGSSSRAVMKRGSSTTSVSTEANRTI